MNAGTLKVDKYTKSGIFDTTSFEVRQLDENLFEVGPMNGILLQVNDIKSSFRFTHIRRNGVPSVITGVSNPGDSMSWLKISDNDTVIKVGRDMIVEKRSHLYYDGDHERPEWMAKTVEFDFENVYFSPGAGLSLDYQDNELRCSQLHITGIRWQYR